jgi:hypothetical protein
LDVSKIVIAAQTEKTDAVADLRRHLPGKSVADIRKALSTGAPLVDRKLFFNDHDEAAGQLKAVVAELQRHGIEPRVYEIDEDANVESLIDSDKQESVEYLDNILARHEQIKADRERRGG